MEIDLNLIGMDRGKQYETIITTVDCENVQNAAPIGVLCSGNDTILCRIFKGRKTLDNIISQREFTVNITHDPELFTLSKIFPRSTSAMTIPSGALMPISNVR